MYCLLIGTNLNNLGWQWMSVQDGTENQPKNNGLAYMHKVLFLIVSLADQLVQCDRTMHSFYAGTEVFVLFMLMWLNQFVSALLTKCCYRSSSVHGGGATMLKVGDKFASKASTKSVSVGYMKVIALALVCIIKSVKDIKMPGVCLSVCFVC